MSFYQNLAAIGKKYNMSAKMYKWGFNFSPMYRRSTARITKVSDNLSYIEVKLPISYKNKNYNGSIFGGSMFAAADPIPMVQLINLLDSKYVVWDKSAEILFKRPARENLYADFEFTNEELDEIIKRVELEKEFTFIKETKLMDINRNVTYCIVNKTIYIADKDFYKEKIKSRNQNK